MFQLSRSASLPRKHYTKFFPINNVSLIWHAPLHSLNFILAMSLRINWPSNCNKYKHINRCVQDWDKKKKSLFEKNLNVGETDLIAIK